MIGKIISHYRILEELGRGGMGVVYKAQDTKLDRTVALKFLPAALTADPDAKARFVHEAKSAAALSHPHISHVYEIDEADGQTFIAIEYIEGRTLKDEIEAGPLKIERAVDLAVQVAQGLQEAHEKGIVHRDIKPANIMITPKGQAKIMDFGLAKARGQTVLTKVETTLGTFAYMSPEQARGEDVDSGTDVWSLGAVLYEMVTGRRPFPGEYEQAVIYSILNEDPEPVTGLRTGVPLELERIIHKCLRKDSRDRYHGTHDLITDLRQVSAVETTAASVPGGKGSRWARWSWLGVVAVLIAVAALLLPPYLKSPETPPTAERKMLVVLPFENLGDPEDEYFADGMTEEITSRLAVVSGLGVISRTSAIKYKNTEKSLPQIGVELGVDYVLEGTIRWERGPEMNRVRVTPQLIRVSDDTHLWASSYERPLESVFAVQSDIAGRVAEALSIALLEGERRALDARPTENLAAYQAYLQARVHLRHPDYAEEHMRLGIQLLGQAVQMDPDFALAYTELSKAHSGLHHWNYDRSGVAVVEAKDAVDRALELGPDMPEAHRALGYYHYWCHREYDRALEEFAIASRGLPNDSDLLADIAYIWRRQGLFEQSIESMKKAAELDPVNSRLPTQIALAYAVLREFREAIVWCDRSIEIEPQQQHAYIAKGAVNWLQGDLRGARAALERMPDDDGDVATYYWVGHECFERDYEAALARLCRFPGEVMRFQDVLAPKDVLAGRLHSALDQPDQARPAFERALVLLEAELEQRPEDPSVRAALAETYAGLGRTEEAIREAERAVELRPVSSDALVGPSYLYDLASVCVRVGEYEKAMDTLEYALSIPGRASVGLVSIDPCWDPLRDHPEFQRIIETHSQDGR